MLTGTIGNEGNSTAVSSAESRVPRMTPRSWSLLVPKYVRTFLKPGSLLGLRAASIRHGGSIGETLLQDLDRLGFFRYIQHEQLKQQRDAVLQRGWGGIFGENGRLFSADAESLAEGGVVALISEMTSFLEGQGVVMPPLAEEFGPGEGYTLLVDGERFPIWTPADYEKDSDSVGFLWGVSSARTVAILNLWLERAESHERAYGVNAGNDFAIFFLTPELYSWISQDPGVIPRYGPYVPTLEYPGFGQPE